MDILHKLFDLQFIIVQVIGYKLSLLELVGTVSGLACVWMTARENIWCWPVGILNIVCFFVMFFQLRLYSDMFLQVYFFVTSIYGWWKWAHPRTAAETNRENQLRVTVIGRMELMKLLAMTAVGVVAFGYLMEHIHRLLPAFFPEPAAFPYADSVVAIGSVVAQWIMARKKLQCWLFWIAVDILAVFIYFLKGINLVAIEYIVFGTIAYYGFRNWRRSLL